MSNTDPHVHLPAASPTTLHDPVCGMVVDPAKSPHHVRHDGHDYHFCGAKCLAKFVAEPARYLHPAPAPVDGLAGTIWTCPMHPEVRQDHAGACPICGMALEPELVSADTGASAEYLDMLRHFWVALALALPVFLLEMGGHVVPTIRHLLAPEISHGVQAVLATPVVLWAGGPFFARAWVSIRTRHLNMFTLVAMGTGVS